MLPAIIGGAALAATGHPWWEFATLAFGLNFWLTTTRR